MSTRYSLDRESFEALLANAFAVQKSGLDRRSLSTLVEIQQFITSDQFDFDEEMRMVANHVLKLSNADGVGIALLDTNTLVYRAGAGRAAKDIGRHVAAVLNVSPAQGVGQEVLRVENAETDKRIEAEVCRQFGATSLLMLPICENHVLRGVLQVLFYDAHMFADREIRVCRLMVGALEEGISRRLQHGQERETLTSVEQVHAAKRSAKRSLQAAECNPRVGTIRASAVEQNVFQGHTSTNKDDHLSKVLSKQSQAPRAVITPERTHAWKRIRTTAASTVRSKWKTDSWRFGTALIAAVILCIVAWLPSVHHPWTSTGGSAVPTRSHNQGPATSKPPLANQEPNQLHGQRRERARRSPGFKRVWINPNEVDDIAEDVTIRHFTTRSAKPQMQDGVKEVNFGDDVTVRYFPNALPVAPQRPHPGREADPKPPVSVAT
jgi:hypothetical protein